MAGNYCDLEKNPLKQLKKTKTNYVDHIIADVSIHSEAENLLKICEKGTIDKIRYEVKFGNHIFEVDEFHGDNEGLVVAEIELKDENQVFEKPKWLGKEVTGDIRYYNSQLSKQPFITWNIKNRS